MKKKIMTKSKLKNILQDINKTYGKNTVYYAKDEPVKTRLPFGIKEIDDFIGGGISGGNFTIIYGGEGIGKSTLAYTQIAMLQTKGLVCVLLDLEHSFDPKYAKIMGINIDKLILICPENAEQAMDITIKLSKAKVVDYIVLDSIQALSCIGENETKKHVEKPMDKDEVALLARRMGKFLRRTAGFVYKAQIGFLFIGQTRTQGIGTFFTHEGLSGGHSIRHWSSMTLHMCKGMKANAPKKGKEIIGFQSVIKVEKHKIMGCSKIGSELKIPFYYNGGFKQKDKNGS